jgi:hypothetical protein
MVMLALAAKLMGDFLNVSSICGKGTPRRYLWTDAFAVTNLFDMGMNEKATELINAVHHVLGKHRDDDYRKGWISGLDDSKGEQSPTIGGLRIGKKMPERTEWEQPDYAKEWEQDGQYHHYLTKWTYALVRANDATNDNRFLIWAADLILTTFREFSRDHPSRLVWKLSIDLRRVLVPSMGEHDALDGLVCALSVLAKDNGTLQKYTKSLKLCVSGYFAMCSGRSMITQDLLGTGGLLDTVARLVSLHVMSLSADQRTTCKPVLHEELVDILDLLRSLISDSHHSLELCASSVSLFGNPEQRLAFRELGLVIGLQAVRSSREELRIHLESQNGPGRKGHNTSTVRLMAELDRLLWHSPLGDKILVFWADPENRNSDAWSDHVDINSVMLATACLHAPV